MVVYFPFDGLVILIRRLFAFLEDVCEWDVPLDSMSSCIIPSALCTTNNAAGCQFRNCVPYFNIIKRDVKCNTVDTTLLGKWNYWNGIMLTVFLCFMKISRRCFYFVYLFLCKDNIKSNVLVIDYENDE